MISPRPLLAAMAVAALALSCRSVDAWRSAEDQPVMPTSLRVLTYNIHNGVGMDGETDLARIAAVIQDARPDVVGLQEIGSAAMARELGRLTGMKAAFGPSKERADQYGDAILSRFPFTWVGNHAIPSASSSRYQAMAVDVDVPTNTGQVRRVRFINTHFDWLDTIGSQEARLAAVEVVERGFLVEDAPPALLVGDLNAGPQSPPLARLTDRGWRLVECRSATWPADAPTKTIDHTLVRPAGSWTVRSVQVIDAPVASDHRPVLTDLDLSNHSTHR